MWEHKEITGMICQEKRELKTTVVIPRQIRKQDCLYRVSRPYQTPEIKFG